MLLAALILIQFIRPPKNISKSIGVNDITTKYFIPDDVQHILKASCYDCHSNNTRYPWYCNFQPFDWWITGHITEGKKELNFDEFNNRSLRYKYHKLESTVDEVKEDHMPLNSYLWIHKDAKLTEDEKSKLINWATAIMNSMKAKYPSDSLVRKK